MISADGIRANFPAVKKLVNAAPDFQHLEVVAFRQPVEDFAVNDMEFGDTTIKPSELSFLYFIDTGQFDLVLIHEAFGTLERESAIGISFLILDAAVGEYRVATELAAIDFAPRNAVPDAYQPLPIEVFPTILDQFRQGRLPN